MDALLAVLNDAVCAINNFLSDYVLLILLIGCGVYFTIRTRFIQVRCFGEGIHRVFGEITLRGKKAGKSGMSSFQALATAIAAQVGTGNIVGACGAILIGGPGAIFWMWVISFFGMATIYAEAVLAQKTRHVDEAGEMTGGPIYYIKTAFKGRFGKILAGFFSVSAILALGFMGAMVQSNSISEAMNSATGIPTWVVGLVIAVLAGFIFVGGVRTIASVTEKMIPLMACFYILGTLIILICRAPQIPATFGMIFKYAFVPRAIIGGSVGMALKQAVTQGVKRGLFSNEAGMGSTPHAHAIANVKHPHDQGVVAMIGVFIDTFIVLTLTALVVISTLYVGHDGLSGVEGYEKTNLAQGAFSSIFGTGIGGIFVALCLLFFAFSTIVSWNYFGKLNFTALFGNHKIGNIIYAGISVVFVFLGALVKNDFVWNMQDAFDMLLVIPNVIALVALGKIVAEEAKEGKLRYRNKKSEIEETPVAITDNNGPQS